MKLIILDEYKLNSYDLPSSQKAFNINYKNEILNLTNNQDRWTLIANQNIELLYKGQNASQVLLEDYEVCYATLKTINKKVQILVFPTTEKYNVCSLTDIHSITIGLSSQYNISYGNASMKDPHATITVGEHASISAAEGALIYVNGKCVTQSNLFIGDVIFISGIRIIWMDNFIKINNPQGKVHLNGLQISNITYADVNNYTKTTESERATKLYDESNLFFHTPKQSTYIKPEEFSIELPPEPEKHESLPIIFSLGTSMMVIASAGMSGFNAIKNLSNTETDKMSTYIEIGVAVLMLVSSLFMPLLLDMYQKGVARKKEKTRQKKYKEYLNKKKSEIETVIKNQENILNEKHFPLDVVCKQMLSQGYAFWSREIIDPDFLSVRLGVGNMPAQVKINTKIEQFSMEDDNLKDMVKDLVNEKKELKNVPISLSLLTNKVTPIVNETSRFYEYANSILLQLLFYYSSVDLKIVLFTSEDNEDKWSFLKYTSHNWSADRERRLFASNESDINQLSMYLEQVYNKRLLGQSNEGEGKKSIPIEEIYKSFDEYYLIITDDYNRIKNIPFINKVINGYNYGFSLLIFSNSLKNIPSRLDKFVVVRDDMCGVFDKNVVDGTNIPFKADYLPESSIRQYANVAANIPIASNDVGSAIPTSLGFLEMFNAGMIEHINITTRWKTNDPTTSINAPLGFQANNKVIGLDLHEKVHGPHGLIAGSTGSGKSEFIITFILSLAVNYHPYEVQFVLIDYKGGGLAGAFEKREKGIKIPHLVGTITNLDKSEMNRSLVSIKSELERRQRKFNEARDALGEGTIDIYKYQRLYREGKVSEPISHLIIISDEFAELKAQQPEFMDELVSTARIGRSLGVHLILATQKPAGVVNDQIWSNSRFKICLKVQTAEDSNEVLKRDDASRIKEAGRFYLQVGNDELFELGQSAWSGEKYIPRDVILNKVNDSLDFVNVDGTIIKSVSDDKGQSEEDKGDQLTNIVDYLYNIAKTENIKFNSLWLPNIPECIYLGNLFTKYSFKPSHFDFNPVIGEYDKPAKQEQGLFSLKINNSNTLVFGSPGAGKELLATSFIYSLCVTHTLQELNVYILDFGGEVLRPFERMPHVGSYITSEEIDKLNALLLYLEKQIKKRKALLAEYGGSFDYYNQKSETKLPLILVVLNAYETFIEMCDAQNDYLMHLLRDSSKYGIVFLITAISTNSVRATTLEYFENKIILKTQDPFDYQYILDAPPGLIPSNHYGRGICIYDEEACEFQTAFINVKEEVNNTIRNTANKLLDVYKARVKSIKVMPNTTSFKDLARQVKTINDIPVGYEVESAELINYNFTTKKITSIIGEEILDDISYMGTLLDLLDTVKDVNMNIFDISSSIDFEGRASYYNSDFEEPFNEILQGNAQVPTINVIVGYCAAESELEDNEYELLKQIIMNADKLNNQYFIIIDSVENYDSIVNDELLSVIDKNNGIYIGNDIDIQKIYNVNNINQIDIDSRMPNKTYYIVNGNALTLKGIGISGDDE